MYLALRELRHHRLRSLLIGGIVTLIAFIREPFPPATEVAGGKGPGAQRHANPKPLDSILSQT